MNQILFSQDSPKTYDMESISSKGPIRYRPGLPFPTSVFYSFFLSHDPQPQWHSTFQSKRTGVFYLEEFFFAHLLVRTLGSQIFTWLTPPVTQASVQITLLIKSFLATSARTLLSSLIALPVFSCPYKILEHFPLICLLSWLSLSLNYKHIFKKRFTCLYIWERERQREHTSGGGR